MYRAKIGRKTGVSLWIENPAFSCSFSFIKK
jgi:hypothetical protein